MVICYHDTPIVRWTKTWEKHPPDTIICLHCHSTLCFQATLTNTLILAKRLVLYPPDKASFGLVVQHDGIFHKLEGTWDGCCGPLSILHCDGEMVRGHFFCSVFSCPAGDLCSEVLSAKTRTYLNTGCLEGVCGGGGSHKVTVQWKATWQQSDSLLNPGFAFSVACYFSVTSA